MFDYDYVRDICTGQLVTFNNNKTGNRYTKALLPVTRTVKCIPGLSKYGVVKDAVMPF